jgi:hypothetical protein
MKIGLHDAEKDHMPDKTFPNYALMKISAWYKAQGDEVEWYLPVAWKSYDKVYSSKIFDFTPVNAYLPPDAIKGGTGYGLYSELAPEMDEIFPDYSIYPDCDYAIGFLTRGCIRNCDWCVVPKKEGKIRPYRAIEQVARPDTNKIVLMDNNILACPYGLRELEKIADSDYLIDLNQGMDIRLITPQIARLLKRIKWIDYIRFSCDTEAQLPYFEKVMPLFRELKIASKIWVYLLVRNDTDEAERRVRALHAINKSISIYAQAERNVGKTVTPAQSEFQNRYIYGRSYKKETWQNYCQKRGFDYA